jgi:hypothetical protein
MARPACKTDARYRRVEQDTKNQTKGSARKQSTVAPTQCKPSRKQAERSARERALHGARWTHLFTPISTRARQASAGAHKHTGKNVQTPENPW